MMSKLIKYFMEELGADMYVADEVDVLLAEKDREIAELERMLKTQTYNYEVDYKKWQKETEEDEAEIERLHGNLNDCTERGTGAEAKVKQLEKEYAQHLNRRFLQRV